MKEKEIKEFLIKKFIEIGRNFQINKSGNKFINTIIESNIFKQKINKKYGKRFKIDIKSNYIIDNCDFGIFNINIIYNNKINVICTYIKQNHKKKLKQEKKYVFDDTSHLVGNIKKQMDDKIKELKNLQKYKNKITYVKIYYKDILDDIDNFGIHTKNNYISLVTLSEYAHIIFYKELFVFLTDEEYENIIIEYEKSKNLENLKNLKSLNINNIRNN